MWLSVIKVEQEGGFLSEVTNSCSLIIVIRFSTGNGFESETSQTGRFASPLWQQILHYPVVGKISLLAVKINSCYSAAVGSRHLKLMIVASSLWPDIVFDFLWKQDYSEEGGQVT